MDFKNNQIDAEINQENKESPHPLSPFKCVLKVNEKDSRITFKDDAPVPLSLVMNR